MTARRDITAPTPNRWRWTDHSGGASSLIEGDPIERPHTVVVPPISCQDLTTTVKCDHARHPRRLPAAGLGTDTVTLGNSGNRESWSAARQAVVCQTRWRGTVLNTRIIAIIALVLAVIIILFLVL